MEISADELAQLAALRDAFADNLAQGDITALAAIYADDAVVLPPGQRVVAGRGSIEMFWRQARQIRSLSFDEPSLKPLGSDAIRETGTLRLAVQGQGGQQREVAAKYVFLWHRVDGEWRLDASMWNRNAGNRAAGQGRGPGRRQGTGGRGRGPEGYGQGVGGGGQAGYGQGVGGGRGQGGYGGRGQGVGGGGQGVGGGRGQGVGGGGQGVGGGRGQGGGGGRGGQGQRGGGQIPFVPRVR